MKTIGLIGGMSWESTATYYRYINQAVRARRGGLASANLIVNSLDFSKVVALQKADCWDLAGAMLGAAGAQLARAGAECVLICTNTMHVVADAVAERSGLPLIDVIDETARAVHTGGHRRPFLLATRYTMERSFYADRMARAGIDVVLPNECDRIAVHEIIFDELCQGLVRPASRDRLLEIIAGCGDQGADSVILGCTELQLLLDAGGLPVPGYNSTQIHADAAISFAMAEPGAEMSERIGRKRAGHQTARR